MTPTARLVVSYTALHLAGFVALGLGVAGLFALAEREKRVLALIFLFGCCLAVVFLALVYGLSQWHGQAVTPTIFLAGHLPGFLAMVGALAWFDGRLMQKMPEALVSNRQAASRYRLPGSSDPITRARLYAIHTDLMFTNSRMPYSESSRP